MSELLTAAQMRAIEAAAIASGKVTGLELMERAGRGVVEAVLEEWPELALTSHKAVILCGPGGNGGDGFVVARLLKERGWEVEVFLYGDEAKLPADAKVCCERWKGVGGVRPLTVEAIATSGGDIVVDAVFGSGLTRPPPEDVMRCLSRIHFAGSGMLRRVSVDTPTGLCMDSGRMLTEMNTNLMSHLTVSFQYRRTGHYLGAGPAMCHALRIVDIGLENEFQKHQRGECFVNSVDDREQLNWGLRKYQLGRSLDLTHKFSHGHALILCGPAGHGGAARLAARGALRIGAGLVSLVVEPEALAENAARVDAVMLRVVGTVQGQRLALEDERINALCIGPGLGVDRAGGLLEVALASGRDCVIDADGLTALAGDAGLFGALHERCVLTPHAGEFARVFPDIAAKLAEPATRGPAYSKVDATREAAKRAGCVVLFKGADTVIAGPDGRCSVNSAHYERSAPWLATAGSGDVLAGFICGLLARGFDPMQAAETAAWLHVECALNFGPGLIAEDLPEMLPAVLRRMDV